MDAQKKRLAAIKAVIIGLLTGAAILFIWPFYTKFQETQLIMQTRVEYAHEMPRTIVPAENIKPLSENLSETLKTRDRTAVGRVIVPSIALVDDIYVGLTNENLTYGAVSLFPKRQPQGHNLVLAGHNVGIAGLHFGRLADIGQGADIYLQYLGNYYHYRVSDLNRIKETDINRVKDTTTSKLSMVTCSAPTRTIYRTLLTADYVHDTVIGQKFNRIVKQTQTIQAQVSKRELLKQAWWPIIGIVIIYIVLICYVIRTV